MFQSHDSAIESYLRRLRSRSTEVTSANGAGDAISVLLITFNQQAHVEKAVATAHAALVDNLLSGEIIVVDDGSTDGTAEVLQRLATSRPELVVIRQVEHRGYGAALRAGLAAAKHELICLSAAPARFDLDQIGRLLFWIDTHPIVTGYRVGRTAPLLNKMGSWGWSLLVRIALGVRVRDSHCGFMLLRRSVLESIELTVESSTVTTELLVAAARSGVRIKEVPVSDRPQAAGASTNSGLRDVARALRELVTVYSQRRGRSERFSKHSCDPERPPQSARFSSAA